MRPRHILTGNTSTQNGMIMMLHSPPSQHPIIKGCDIPSHEHICAGLELGVDEDAAVGGVDFQVGLAGELGVGGDTDGGDDVVGVDGGLDVGFEADELADGAHTCNGGVGQDLDALLNCNGGACARYSVAPMASNGHVYKYIDTNLPLVTRLVVHLERYSGNTAAIFPNSG